MKKATFITALYFLSIPIFCQNRVLKGMVLNAQNNEPIPFAVVGLIQANKGVSTDEMGQFELENVDNQDTLIVSSLGFKKELIVVSDYKEGKIKLMPVVLELPIVTIKPRKSQKRVVNEFNVKDINHFLTTKMVDTTSMTQLAQYFENPKNATWFVRELKLVRSRYYGTSENDKVKFRLRFYGVDTVGKPDGKDLCEPILLISKKEKLIKLDMAKANLIIPSKGLFVAIEWLKVKENFHEFNYKTLDNKTGKDYNYKPSIGLNLLQNDENLIFRLDYRGVWHQYRYFFKKDGEGKNRSLAISLTLSD